MITSLIICSYLLLARVMGLIVIVMLCYSTFGSSDKVKVIRMFMGGINIGIHRHG